MRPILTLTVLVAATAGVIVGCKNSTSKETKNATSTTTTQQPAIDEEAERKRLADQNAQLEAEKRRLEEEQKRLQAELDKAKADASANAPANASVTNYCGSIVRGNNGSFLACREYAGYDQANITRLQQQCSGLGGMTGGTTGNPTWDQLIQILNQNRGQNGQAPGTWGNGGCPRTMQGAASVGTCKFIQGWATTYWDVYYAPWTSANAQSDCENRRGTFGAP